MANPNLANVSTGYGAMAFQNVTTVFANILVNSSTSNTILKVNSLLLNNIDAGSNIGNVTLTVSNAGVTYNLLTNVSVPVQSSMVAITKDSTIYVLEGQYVQIKASSNNVVHAVASFDTIG